MHSIFVLKTNTHHWGQKLGHCPHCHLYQGSHREEEHNPQNSGNALGCCTHHSHCSPVDILLHQLAVAGNPQPCTSDSHTSKITNNQVIPVYLKGNTYTHCTPHSQNTAAIPAHNSYICSKIVDSAICSSYCKLVMGKKKKN